MRESITVLEDNRIIATPKLVELMEKNVSAFQKIIDFDYDSATIIDEYGKSIVLKIERTPICSIGTNIKEKISKEVGKIIHLTDEFETKYEELNEIIDTFPQMIFQIDPDGKILRLNKSMVEKLGYTKEEMETEFQGNIFGLVIREDLEELVTNTTRVLNGENISGKIRYHIRTKKGTIMSVTVSSKPIYNNDGEPKYIFGVIYDLTDIEKYEKQIEISERQTRESEKKLREILENIGIGVIVLEKNGTTSFCNAKIGEMTACSREEFIKTNIFDFIHPQDKQKVIKNWKNRLDGKNVPMEYDFRIINKKLETKHILAHIVHNQDGRILASYTDITELNKTRVDLLSINNDLKESEEKFRNIFSYSRYPILILDANTGKIEDINNAGCELFGYSIEQFQSMFAMDISAESEETQKSFKNKREGYYERLLKKSDGTAFPVEMSTRFYKINSISKQVAIIKDITEQKLNEQILKEKQKELEAKQKEHEDFFNSTSLGITKITLAGEIINPNPALIKILGFDSVEQLSNENKTFKDFIVNKTDYDEAIDIIQKNPKEHITVISKIINFKTGKIINCYLNIGAFINQKDEIQYLKINLQEIEKTAEKMRNIISMCSVCKDILHKDGKPKEDINKFISKTIGMDVSHGLCPDCAKKTYPEFF